MSAAESLSKLRKRRAVVRRSITCLSNGLRDLEATPDRDGVIDRAQQYHQDRILGEGIQNYPLGNC